MTYSALSSLRRAVALAAIAGIAATAPAAVAAPAKKSKAAKRSATADLVVRDLDVEVFGETIGVSATISNKGTFKARRSDVFVAISSDAILDDDDEVLEEIEIRKVKPGKSRSVETEVDVPADEDLPSGDVYLLVCADGGEVVRERDETNNCSAELLASADDAAASGDEASADDSSAEEASVEIEESAE